jgi:signal transduction histidine kinase
MRSSDDIPAADLLQAGLVHDLNNVFQTLVGVAMQLESEPELAAAILRCVQRGQNIAAGLSNPSNAPVPFQIVLENASAFLHDYQAATNAPPVVVCSQVEPGVHITNHGAWERVLINLFLNSVRAMPGGGAIQVTARTVENGTEIRIADEGCGISPELMDHLFEPHVSGHGSTGLGLSIVDSILRSQDGRIEAANRRDAPGAEFRITMRAAPKSIAAQNGR